MEKKKREEDRVSLIVMSILTPIPLTFMVLIVASVFNEPTVESIVGSVIFGAINVMFILVLYTLIFTREYIRDHEYVIFEFEKWDFDSRSYKKYYDYGVNKVFAKYRFFKQVDSYISEYTEDMLIKHHTRESDWSPTLYSSKEEVMKLIYSNVKDKIKMDEKNKNVTIRMVNKLETMTIEELEEIVKQDNTQ